jgi:hypothetical protein
VKLGELADGHLQYIADFVASEGYPRWFLEECVNAGLIFARVKKSETRGCK